MEPDRIRVLRDPWVLKDCINNPGFYSLRYSELFLMFENLLPYRKRGPLQPRDIYSSLGKFNPNWGISYSKIGGQTPKLVTSNFNLLLTKKEGTIES